MNISALNAPATPPYDYQNHNSTINNTANDNKNTYSDIFFDRQPSPDHHSTTTSSDNEMNHSAFRRVSSMSMPSPPELLIDTSEDDEEEETASYTSLYHMHPKNNYSNRKSVPHRSPSNLLDHKSVVFQIEKNCTPKILGGGILWSLRQRVSKARRQQQQQQNKNRLSAPHPERRVRPMRIQIPRPQWSNASPTTSMTTSVSRDQNDAFYENLVSPLPVVSSLPQPTPSLVNNITAVAEQPTSSWQNVKKISTAKQPVERKKTTAAPRKHSTTHHATSGRPSRVKGPCQACHETSDGCMRKAFNWPFPTSTIFNDKGKPFVYLCNKCGLRYNKSGGCVCRHCRWVLCKEEKRKAMQLIDQMRRSRPDGRIDLDEDIENFACSPKYWSCGRPWKVGWVLNSQHDDADDEEDSIMMDQHSSPSLSEATL